MSSAARFEPDFAGAAGGRAGRVIASYDTYGEGERAVDQFADSGFPVERTEIVGRDFSSASRIVPSRYDVTVPDEHAERARELLSRVGFGRHTPEGPDTTAR